jgi:hypothetical protein
VVNEKAAGKEKLIAKLSTGPEITQTDLGNPLASGGNSYRLCIYGDDAALAGELAVDRAGDACGAKPCWNAIGGEPPDGKGFTYKDAQRASDGVKVIKLKGGAAGKSLLLVNAANNAQKGQVSMPTGISVALAGDAFATVQIHVSNGGCFSTGVTEVKHSATEFFKAKK